MSYPDEQIGPTIRKRSSRGSKRIKKSYLNQKEGTRAWKEDKETRQVTPFTSSRIETQSQLKEKQSDKLSV